MLIPVFAIALQSYGERRNKKVAFDVLYNIIKCNFLQSAVSKRVMKNVRKAKKFLLLCLILPA